jgi:hypothetical protein
VSQRRIASWRKKNPHCSITHSSFALLLRMIFSLKSHGSLLLIASMHRPEPSGPLRCPSSRSYLYLVVPQTPRPKGTLHRKKSVVRQLSFQVTQLVLNMCFMKSRKLKATAFDECISSASSMGDWTGNAVCTNDRSACYEQSCSRP